MSGFPCLNHKATARMAEASQQLEGPFIGPEVLTRENSVGGKQGYQADVAAVESPGGEIVSHQDVKLSPGKGADGIGLVFRRSVQKGYAGPGIQFLHLRLQFAAFGESAFGPCQQHLLPGIQRFLDTGQQLQGQAAHHPLFPILCADIDDFPLFPVKGTGVFLPSKPDKSAVQGIVERFQGGSGSGKQHACLVDGGQHDGAFPGMVARSRGILLVGRVLLLVHYHQSQTAEREKKGAAGSQNQLGLPCPNLLFHQLAPGRREPAVVLERTGIVLRKGNFRNQDQDAFPPGQHLRRKAQADIPLFPGRQSRQEKGLAAARKVFADLAQQAFFPFIQAGSRDFRDRRRLEPGAMVFHGRIGRLVNLADGTQIVL